MNQQRKFKIAIVAPVHKQPTELWVQSLQRVAERSNARVIIVDDSDGKVELPESWDVYDYNRQKEELGDELYARFEKFHKSSACKNFGHWLAWRDGADIIMGVDSDCTVPPNFVADHMRNLMTRSFGWTNPIAKTGFFSRGFPYAERDIPTAASLGLWEGELDLYGTDRVANPNAPTSPMCEESTVADGIIPFSGMNWAIWADRVPALLFLPNFEYTPTAGGLSMEYKFRRHDDIWGGYIFQKIMAIQNERIRYGFPIVTHDSGALQPEKDAEEEIGMIHWEATFYNAVDSLIQDHPPLIVDEYEQMFAEVADDAMEQWENTEWGPVADAMVFWKDLFLNSNRKI